MDWDVFVLRKQRTEWGFSGENLPHVRAACVAGRERFAQSDDFPYVKDMARSPCSYSSRGNLRASSASSNARGSPATQSQSTASRMKCWRSSSPSRTSKQSTAVNTRGRPRYEPGLFQDFPFGGSGDGFAHSTLPPGNPISRHPGGWRDGLKERGPGETRPRWWPGSGECGGSVAVCSCGDLVRAAPSFPSNGKQ